MTVAEAKSMAAPRRHRRSEDGVRIDADLKRDATYGSLPPLSVCDFRASDGLRASRRTTPAEAPARALRRSSRRGAPSAPCAVPASDPRRRSCAFCFGRMTSCIPARRAASTFSLMPPTGRTRPDSVISPVIATIASNGPARELRHHRRRHRHTGRRAVLGDRARRHVDVHLGVLEEVGIDAVLTRVRRGSTKGPRAPTPS